MGLIGVLVVVGLSLIMAHPAPGLSKGISRYPHVPPNSLSIPKRVTAKDKQAIVLLPCPVVVTGAKKDSLVIWLDNDKHLVHQGIASSGDLELNVN